MIEGKISADLYESIMDGITSGVWVADRDDIIYYANRAMEMIAGVTQQRLIGFSAIRSFSEGDREPFVVHYNEAKTSLRPVYYSEVPVVTPAGRQTFQSGWLIPKVKEDRYDGMICTVEDITNQRQARRALDESEARYRELVESANSIIMRMNGNGEVTFMNLFARKFFGFSDEEIIGKSAVGTIVQVTPERRQNFENMLVEIAAFPERYENYEEENIRKNGEPIWIAWTLRVLLSEEGRFNEILCVGNDITAQKLHEQLLNQCRRDLEKEVALRTLQLSVANEELQQEILERKWVEQSLRTSEGKYRLVVENANEGIIVNQDGFFKYVNPKATRIWGYSKEQLMSRQFYDFIHPDDRDMVIERHLKRIKGDNLPNNYFCRIVDSEGVIKWLEINSVLITWMGRPATLAFFNNVTERKRAEEMLDLLNSAVQQTTDSVIITTADPVRHSSQIVFVNPAFTKMTGYSAEEVIGKPSLILQDPETQKIIGTHLDDGSSRKAFLLESTAQRKDGSRFNLEWQILPLRDEKGRVTHIVSTQRDVTEKKKAEEQFAHYREQLHSLASELSLTEERERRRIAQNIHDHIGQTLAITKMRLGELKSTAGAESLREGIDDIRALVDDTIHYTKSLTFELSPPILYEFGFEAAIEWLAEQMQKQHYILFTFLNNEKPKPLTTDMSILLFQVARELFLNVVKHAQAHEVIVLLDRSEDRIVMRIEDDGIGFDTSKIDTRWSFGFFSIRERLKYLGGSMQLDSTPGKGTRIAVAAPLVRETVGVPGGTS